MGQGPEQLTWLTALGGAGTGAADVADSAGWGRDRVRWRWPTALGGAGTGSADVADSAGWGRDRVRRTWAMHEPSYTRSSRRDTGVIVRVGIYADCFNRKQPGLSVRSILTFFDGTCSCDCFIRKKHMPESNDVSVCIPILKLSCSVSSHALCWLFGIVTRSAVMAAMRSIRDSVVRCVALD